MLSQLVATRRVVDTNRALVDLNLVHPFLGDGGEIGRGVGDEAEAAGAARLTVDDHLSFNGRAFAEREGFVERLVSGSPGQVADEETVTAAALWCHTVSHDNDEVVKSGEKNR